MKYFIFVYAFALAFAVASAAWPFDYLMGGSSGLSSYNSQGNTNSFVYVPVLSQQYNTATGTGYNNYWSSQYYNSQGNTNALFYVPVGSTQYNTATSYNNYSPFTGTYSGYSTAYSGRYPWNYSGYSRQSPWLTSYGDYGRF